MSGLSLSRRQFLARCGALGAAAMIVLPPRAAGATGTRAAAALRVLAVDTMAGLVAFIVPGPDAYSQAQGVTDDRPGGVAARAPEGLVELFDRFLPMPDSFAQVMTAAFATGLSEAPLPGLEPLVRAAEGTAATVDRALVELLSNDETVPLSLAVAMMLNFVATSVNPRALAGPFASAPFANLAFAEKAEVFRRIEEHDAELVALLDREAPEPMRAGLSGQIEFLGGALPGAAALFSYCEWGVFDRERRVATTRPVGWDLTNYAPGRTTPADGWDEFRGYYRGRRRARTRRRGRRSGRRA